MDVPQSPSKKRLINKSEFSRQYFTFVREETFAENDEIKKFFQCNICKREINGTKNSNLASHLQTHQHIFSKLSHLDDSIEEKRLKLLFDCVELVAINGNTFSRLYDSGSLFMIGNTLEELKVAGRALNLTDPHLTEVKRFLVETARNVEKKIADEMKNHPLSLMADITTIIWRRIFGVSAQFIDNGTHKIRSIGMVELIDSHTAVYLSKVICDLLDKYGITSRQLIAITTDNGANVLKMVRDVEEQLIAAEGSHQRLQSTQQMDPDDFEIDNYLLTVPEVTDDDALDRLFGHNDDEFSDNDGNIDEMFGMNRNQEHQNLCNVVVSNLQRSPQTECIWEIDSVHCVEHTAQLAITTGIKKISKSNKNIISLSRRVAKAFRLKSTSHDLRRAEIEYTVPHLDVTTRWCSTYTMVMFNYLFA